MRFLRQVNALKVQAATKEEVLEKYGSLLKKARQALQEAREYLMQNEDLMDQILDEKRMPFKNPQALNKRLGEIQHSDLGELQMVSD